MPSHRAAGTPLLLTALALAALALAGCRSGGLADLSGIAAEPALPYSVLVTGGAFAEFEPDGEVAHLRRTYRPTAALDEAIPLGTVVQVLRQGRVFVRIAGDDSDPALRAKIAAQIGPAPVHEAELQAFLERARRGGHDFLLVVERLEDGPVELRGVNGQWPITAAVWLMIGLGMVIPDHTYESKAQLHVALRDVQSGRTLYSDQFGSGLIDLSLIERTDFLGLVESIVVPPFLVGDDDEAVEAIIRDTASARLLVSMARDLKAPPFRSKLLQQLPARVVVVLDGDAIDVEVLDADSLSSVRVQVDATPMRGPRLETFGRALLDSAEERGGRWSYRARFPRPATGSHVQVLVQTVTGRVASATVSLVQ